MKCDRYRELLSWYIESDLQPEEMEAVAEHLSVCQACVEELQWLEETLTLARELPSHPPPAEACAQLLKKVKTAAEPKETWAGWKRPAARPAVESR